MDKAIENYKKGFPFLKIVASATQERGICVINDEEAEKAIERYEAYDGKIVKFVPASGAASRMFKDLFEAQEVLKEGGAVLAGSHGYKFFNNLENFPFYDAEKMSGLSNLEILEYILGSGGLNYGASPKGLILFHKYDSPSEVHTPFEEHMVEGALYAKGKDDKVYIHFTVSPEHMDDFKALLEKVRGKYEERYGCQYEVTFSIQDPSTNIIAVNEDNTPFLKNDGTPLYRPGGHGALLKNLNDIDGDIIVLKNIDNVVRLELKEDSVYWKKVLSGKLLELKGKIFMYLHALDKFLYGEGMECDSCHSSVGCPASAMPLPKYDSLDALCDEIMEYLDSTLCVKIPSVPKSILPQYLHDKLNRPIRVCGMVKNEGEPGGGPFIVYDNDMSTSLQILEKGQLNPYDPGTNLLLSDSTHFNPVDIVCSTTNYLGEKFDLQKFVDPETGLISSKSYEGRNLKAQELPGLWNGSMSNWNTLFVQTPLSTFNPVKTVLDLLRPEHRGM